MTISDQAQASFSTEGNDRYMSDSVTIFNGATTSNLVNITLTVTWEDVFPDGVNGTTTSMYEDGFSDSRCTETGPQTLSCTAPRSLAPGAFETYVLVFRTATDQLATHTVVTPTAAAKEQTKPSKGGNPSNDAFITVPNPTPYEGSEEQDVSTAGGDISVTLATEQGPQFSQLPVPEDAPRGVFELLEEDYGDGVSCPEGLTCFDGSQFVTTVAEGLFPVNLRIDWTGFLPPGGSETSIVLGHLRDGDTTVTIIEDTCSGDLFSGQPPLSEIEPNGCLRTRVTHFRSGLDRVEIDAWDISNGGWGPGIG